MITRICSPATKLSQDDWDWENPALELPGWLTYIVEKKPSVVEGGEDSDSDFFSDVSALTPFSTQGPVKLGSPERDSVDRLKTRQPTALGRTVGRSVTFDS